MHLRQSYIPTLKSLGPSIILRSIYRTISSGEINPFMNNETYTFGRSHLYSRVIWPIFIIVRFVLYKPREPTPMASIILLCKSGNTNFFRKLFSSIFIVYIHVLHVRAVVSLQIL